MKTNHILRTFCTLMLVFLAISPGTASAALIHRWTFDDGTPNDSIGAAHGTIFNGATISGGQLYLDGVNDYLRTSALNQSISNRTLVVWVTLSNLTQQSGSALTIENPTGADVFDGIIYGEAVANRWINGSDGAARWQDNGGITASPAETSTSQVCMAIVYGDGSANNIKIYRNGVLYTDYTPASPLVTYPGGTADVLMGVRHSDIIAGSGTATGNDQYLAGSINEARIYDTALTAGEIAGLFDFGSALSFNSINQQYVSVTNFGSIIPTNEVTVEFWANTAVTAGQSAFILNPDSDENRFQAHINYGDSGDGLTYWDFGDIGGNGRISRSAPASSIGNWVHYAFVSSQSNDYLRIYTNGVLQATESGMSPFVRGDFELRIGGGGNNFPYSGSLDEFRVWNTARSAEEIQSSYNTLLVGNEPGLLVYYRFDNISGNVATNSATATGPAFNGILVNGPASVESGAAPLIVTSTADSGPGSFRQLVASAAVNSTIAFAPGLSGQTITLTTGEIVLDKNITIDGSGLTSGIQLSGNNNSRIFFIKSATVVMNSLTLKNASAPGNYGGGIYSQGGTLSLDRCTFVGNTATAGAGVFSDHLLTVNQCTFQGNSATQGGGIAIYGGSATVNQSTVSGNSATSDSGGIANFGTLNVNNSIIAGNTAPILANIGNAGTVNRAHTLEDVDAMLASLGDYGGPTQTMPPMPGSPAIDAGDDSVTNSFATDQRGMSRRLGAHVDIGAVEANLIPVVTTTADSGAGSLRATLSQADTGATITFATNLSGQTMTLNSGDLVTSKTLTINGSALAKGISISGGNNSRVLTVDTGGNVTLIGLSLVDGNGVSSFAPVGEGGAVLNKGTLAITGCTIRGNSAGFGGAIRNQGVIALTNCTLTGNSSPNEGGAFFGAAGSSAVITHCTVSANDAGTRGGGISLASATAAINNTIIAGNTLAGSATDPEANLVGSPSGGGNLINASPELSPLGNYGGPTQTMPPLPGSPAIDAASNIGLITDQRGFTRPVDGDANTNAVPDIGAVEPQIVPLVAGTYNGLFYENDGVTHGRSGFFTAKATTLRKFSAKLNLAGTSISFSGQFDATGKFSNSVPRKGRSPLVVKLYSIVTNEIYGTVTDTNWTAALFSDRAVFSKTTNRSPQAGRYTTYIPGGSNPTNAPAGSGFGTVIVDSAGKVTLKGTLADGSALAQTTTISKNGEWPLYVALNKGKGSVLGWVGFTAGTAKSFRGDLNWTRLADPLAKNYPAGFVLDTSIHGSQYTPPASGVRILNYSDPFIRFNGVNFNLYYVYFNLGTDNKISNIDPLQSLLTLKFTTSSGLFSGTVLDPITLKPVAFKGVVDQIGQDGYGTGNGFFLQSSLSGRVFIWVD